MKRVKKKIVANTTECCITSDIKRNNFVRYCTGKCKNNVLDNMFKVNDIAESVDKNSDIVPGTVNGQRPLYTQIQFI